MREEYLESLARHQPFAVFLNAGFTPSEIKAHIIQLLDPYVADKDLLQRSAVEYLAHEAISIGRLSSQVDWKALLDLTFLIRQEAIASNKNAAFEVFCSFELYIREAQRKFSLLVTFERDKEEFELDEFAHELFGNIGDLTEAMIQPFLKELYCLACIHRSIAADPIEILSKDFGWVVEQFEKLLANPNLLSPQPWGLRISQWRNIAQHHSFVISNGKIVATYGKSKSKKHVEVTRTEALAVAQELMQRLGALKSSRELTILNHIAELQPLLPQIESSLHGTTTELAAACAVQGFTLEKIDAQENIVIANFVDIAPHLGEKRYIHCSQFVLAVAFRFPDKNIEVHYRSVGDNEEWVFSATAGHLDQIMKNDDPLAGLAGILKYSKKA